MNLTYLVVRILTASVFSGTAMFALARAFKSTDVDRYMRLCVATLAGVLAFGQVTYITGPVTVRSYALWIGAVLCLVWVLSAIRFELKTTTKRRRP